MARPNQGVVPGDHWLIIGVDDEGERLWEVRHGAGCKTETWVNDLSGCPIRNYVCAVGSYISEFGLDCGPSIDGLYPGCYRIEAWWSRSPSTPAHAEEYDGGIQFVGDVG